MSTNDPMTQERLNAIRERLDCGTPTTADVSALLAEVERLQHFESIVSWRYGDTTDGLTREDMVERAARAMWWGEDVTTFDYVGWNRLPERLRENYCADARYILDAVLGTGEGS